MILEDICWQSDASHLVLLQDAAYTLNKMPSYQLNRQNKLSDTSALPAAPGHTVTGSPSDKRTHFSNRTAVLHCTLDPAQQLLNGSQNTGPPELGSTEQHGEQCVSHRKLNTGTLLPIYFLCVCFSEKLSSQAIMDAKNKVSAHLLHSLRPDSQSDPVSSILDLLLSL